jgi:hypothetical protein
MSQYRFLSAHFIGNRFYAAGEVASTADVIGGSLPLNWVPHREQNHATLLLLRRFGRRGLGQKVKLICSSPRPQPTSLSFPRPRRRTEPTRSPGRSGWASWRSSEVADERAFRLLNRKVKSPCKGQVGRGGWEIRFHPPQTSTKEGTEKWQSHLKLEPTALVAGSEAATTSKSLFGSAIARGQSMSARCRRSAARWAITSLRAGGRVIRSKSCTERNSLPEVRGAFPWATPSRST